MENQPAVRKVYVDGASELSRFHVYENALPGPIPGKSVEQIVSVLLARQCGREDVGEALLTPGGRFERDPSTILTHLDIECVSESAPAVFLRRSLYQDVVLFQAQDPASPLRAALLELAEQDKANNKTSVFVVCSGSRNDRVLGCFLLLSKASVTPTSEYPGANLYGEVLKVAYDSLRNNEIEFPRWGYEQLAAVRVAAFSDVQLAKGTVVMYTDSFGKWLKHLAGGIVKPQGGARFSDAVAWLAQEGHVEVHEICLIHVGINVAQIVNDKMRRQECNELMGFLAALRERCPSMEIVISLPFRHEDVDVPAFNTEIRERLTAVLDITVVEIVEPFWENGARNMRYYNVAHGDGFHLTANS